MSFLDDTTLTALGPGDLAALEHLREDRAADGDGLTKAELEVTGCTMHVGSLLGRLRRNGVLVGEEVDGRLVLVHDGYDLEGKTPTIDDRGMDGPERATSGA